MNVIHNGNIVVKISDVCKQSVLILGLQMSTSIQYTKNKNGNRVNIYKDKLE